MVTDAVISRWRFATATSPGRAGVWVGFSVGTVEGEMAWMMMIGA